MMNNGILDSILSRGEAYRVLFRQLEDRTYVHAYMITGEKGTGKKTLAHLMGTALLCSSETDRPCGSCRNCLLCKTFDHPDLIRIEKGNPIAPGLKKDRQTIPVEDIREMIRLCGIRSPEGNMHVVLIFGADQMTTQAQNCLLKTLEDPPADTCIILVTDHPESVLTTVVSRCRPIRMNPWDDAYILRVLKSRGIAPDRAGEAVASANGSIGRALELAADDRYWELREEVLNCFFRNTARSEVLKFSSKWKDRKQDAGQIFSILGSFVATLTESRFGSAGKTGLNAFPLQWQNFSAKAPADRFLLLSDTVSEAQKQLQFSVNFQAVLEKVIYIFMGEGNKWLQ